MLLNDPSNFQQHILFDLMIGLPIYSFGERINEKVYGGRPKGHEIHHQHLLLINVVVIDPTYRVLQ